MKRMAAMVLAGVVVAGSAAADFEKGVKAGVNIATLSGDAVKDAKSVTGIVGGVFLSVGFGPLAVEPDILFTQKGATFNQDVLGTAIKFTQDFSYIDIPVLLKYNIIPAGPVKPYIGAGPAVSFLMSAKSKAEIAGATNTTDVKDALQSYDYSVVVDAGVTFSVAVLKLSADVRYAIGLADISKTSGVSTKNSVISILAGVAF